MNVTVKESKLKTKKVEDLEDGDIFKRPPSGNILRLVKSHVASNDVLAINVETGERKTLVNWTRVLPAIEASMEVRFPKQ